MVGKKNDFKPKQKKEKGRKKEKKGKGIEGKRERKRKEIGKKGKLWFLAHTGK